MSTTADQSSTFLFTDIEGSTRLWSRAGDAMPEMLQRHETLLRRTIEARGGHVFKSVGDGVCAVFPEAPDAIRAAVEAQRQLLAEAWEGFEQHDRIRVRIGVHTGDAEARDGDYFGPTLNRLSRVLDAGHGAQVLCTAETVAACGEHWPDGIGMRDLGERTLRDVPGSVHIFQLTAEGLPEQFPPLDTLDPRVHNLPRWSSPLVGRETEAAHLRAALRSNEIRMVSVLGTGGVGKTRLTTEIAAQLLDEFQHGIRFVDLSALREEGQVVPAIVQVTGATDQLLSPKDALLEWLSDRELLLVLDNCEQVVSDVASICSEIVRVAPHVTLVATSRVPVRIRGEQQLALEPLPVATGGTGGSAEQLFAERAREVIDNFTLSADNAGAIADICRSVDGLPLAIELAAAWVRILSPEALQRRLGESRAILRDGARDLPDRQRTLTNTIAWSYDLLEPEDQRAFRRLAVFRGGIAVDAAAAVLWDSPNGDPLWALSRLDALVQANLLQVTNDPTGEPRFVMLQTIQEFAVDVLRQSGEWDEASAAHADFFFALAAKDKEHAGTADVGLWLDRLDLDFENLRSAVRFYATSPGMGEDSLRLIVSLAGFLDKRCHVTEARSWFELAYRENERYPPELQIDALVQMGNIWLSDPLVAARYYRKAVEIADQVGESHLRIRPVAFLSYLAAQSGDYETAMAMAKGILAEGKRLSVPSYQVLGYYQVAYIACEAGSFKESLEAIWQLRSFAHEIGDLDREAWGWVLEGRTYRRLGQPKEASMALDHAVTRFEATGDVEVTALCHLERGLALLETDKVAARGWIDIAVPVLAETMDAYSIIATIEGVARLLVQEQTFGIASELIGAAQRSREQTRIVAPLSEATALQRSVDLATDTIGTTAFEQGIERGRMLSPRAAIERYLSIAS